MGNFRSCRYWFLCIMLSLPGLSCTSARIDIMSGVPGATIRQAEGFLKAGEYKKALDAYASVYDKHPELRDKFISTGDKVRNIADAAFQEKKYPEAGLIYHMLLKSGITARDFAASLSFNPAYLNGRIEACSEALTEMGLVKYREEKLEEAIATWEKILPFYPDNKGVMKAVATATRQLNKLNKLDK